MQRVSIGRAIVREPQVFLMDEPLSALDAKLREALRSELKDLQMRLGATFIFVTHDQVEAMTMGDRIGVLNHGTPRPGRHAARGLHQSARHVRRELRRLAGDQPAARPASPATARGGAQELSSCRWPAAGRGRRRLYLRHPARGRAASNPARRSKPAVHDIENHGIEKILTLRVGDSVGARGGARQASTSRSRTPSASAGTPTRSCFFDAQTGMNLAHKAA